LAFADPGRPDAIVVDVEDADAVPYRPDHAPIPYPLP
jgi:hypothetical protein